MKAMAKARASLAINDVAARLWEQSGKHDAAPDATSQNLARLIEYFGKVTPLTDIDHACAMRMVAWRRGHHRKGRKKAPLIASATVNRSTTQVLQRLFTFAKAEGAVLENEPKWGELILKEPPERVRELHDHEATRLDDRRHVMEHLDACVAVEHWHTAVGLGAADLESRDRHRGARRIAERDVIELHPTNRMDQVERTR